MEDGARKEGQLVFYTTLSLTDYPKIITAFESRYPLTGRQWILGVRVCAAEAVAFDRLRVLRR